MDNSSDARSPSRRFRMGKPSSSLAALECVDVDYRFGKFLGCLLRQVMSDATSDEAVFVLAREFSTIGCVDGMRRTVRVPFHGDRRHGNHRTRGQSLLQFVVLRLTLRQAD